MVWSLFLVERPRRTLAPAPTGPATSAVTITPAAAPAAPGAAASTAECCGPSLFDRLPIRNLTLEPRDRGQVDATLGVDLGDLDLETFADLHRILNPLDAALSELGDVNQP